MSRTFNPRSTSSSLVLIFPRLIRKCEPAIGATRHTDTKELDAARFQVARARVGVSEVRVAAVNDEIALVEVRQQILDDRIHRRAGGHEHHDRAWPPQKPDELRNVRRAVDLSLFAFLGQRIDFGRVLVVAGHGKTLIGHVEQEIASYDAKADHADFICG